MNTVARYNTTLPRVGVTRLQQALIRFLPGDVLEQDTGAVPAGITELEATDAAPPPAPFTARNLIV